MCNVYVFFTGAPVLCYSFFFVVYRHIPSKPLASGLFDLTDMFSVYVGSFPGVQAKPTSQM